MAVFLDRLGRLAFRRRWRVLLMWMVALVAAGTASTLAPAAPDGSYSMPGTESQRAYDLIEQRFPGASVGGSAEGASAKIVFVAPEGQKVTAQQNRSVIDEVVGEVDKVDQVVRAADPFQAEADAVSEDGSTAYASVTFEVKAKDVSDAAKQDLEKAVEEGRDAGLTVEVSGSVLASQPSGGVTEMVGVLVAAVVLLITFGSLAAAGLPLLTALIGVGIGTATILALSSALGLSSATSTLALMLGLAVGIDYAMFIVSRYREECARGLAPQDAAGVAVGTAGSSVVFAGLTVVIGLAGLSVVGIPTLTQMGLAAAGTVALSVLVAVTLIPAMLGIFPRAVLARSVRRAARAGVRPVPDRPNLGSRWAGLVVRRPLPVLLVAVAALGVIALPAAQLHLGTAGDESKPTSTTERRAYDDLAKGFGPGFNGPLTIVVDAETAKDPKAAVAATAREIGATEGVVSVSAARFNSAGDTAIFTATPATAPTDERTIDLIHTLRGDRPAIEKATDATFMVSGSTAGNIDSDQKVQGALVPYLGLVVGLAFLLLLIVFRSVLVPLKAALGFLLSVLAALGAVVAVFQWGWLAGLLGVDQTGPIMNTMPIVMVGIVFGLAMDYEVFLVTRIREAHLQGERPGQAIVSGFRHSARVVVAAAVIMISVFSGFIGVGETLIKMIGFGMAIAVLFDAFVVRMTTVPAVLALLGERAWTMPRRLERIVPHVDVEGHALPRDAAITAVSNDEAERRDLPVH